MVLVAIPVVSFVYGYFGYPAVLWILTRRSEARPSADAARTVWPMISISLPAFNEQDSIARTLDRLLEIDYPADRRQIVVVSDASSDGTDDIVRTYADRGVELVRVEERKGKTAAEAAAIPHLRGEVVINTDATILIPPASVKPLVQAFDDPTVGVASGRDVSVGSSATEANSSESGYVGYEMWVRSLETRFGSIVGASGCFYAIRRDLHRPEFPADLSRDFASCIIARESGFRSVSVEPAICYVPRTASLEKEYRRKIRTMARGLNTLWYKRALLNPFRYGRFSWMLASHKLSRWLVWLTWPGALVGLGLVAWGWPVARPVAALALVGLLLAWIGWRWPGKGRPPRLLVVAGYALASAVAGWKAWMQALGGKRNAIWEPTRR
jgi:cellulose synthase/poly-beta-1,6-N-acetylglucosamine synthase-like glycosyltransferase